MKKVTVALFACTLMVAGVFAQAAQEPDLRRTETRTISPVCFSMEGEKTIDIVGLRLSAWGTCQTVTGLDLSIAGEAVNAYGVQLGLIRNKVLDRAGALQLALFSNEATQMTGAQVAIGYNQANMAKGLQLAIINNADDMRGFQVGLINTTSMIHGYQIGLINVIKGSTVPFLPIINTMLTAE